VSRVRHDFDIVAGIRAALVAERRRQNLTQYDLAALLDVQQPWISEIESGSAGNITLATLTRWVSALNVRLEVKIRNGRVEAWVLPLEVAAVN
jgi:transcriptional regulator with XRE-family HTH domain